MFLELHMIQNFAPSNLNRDDTNNPKDCTFGGVRRARISSQSLKRAIRTDPIFGETTGHETGIRSRLLAAEIQKRFIVAGASEPDALAMAEALTFEFTPKDKKASDDSEQAARTQVLVYISPEEIGQLCQPVIDNWAAIYAEVSAGSSPLMKQIVDTFIKETKGRTAAPDIALFGRMLADRPETNIDAACQVAHAISTHSVAMDIDFFTAVDDLQSGEETGAGMMGVTAFNSATFYRYARLDFDQLVQNLYGDAGLARRTVEGFVRAAVAAVPSGKQNSFAAHNPPSFVLGIVRGGGMAVSLANAFEKPVLAGKDGLVAPSVAALDAYWGRVSATYGIDGTAAALALDPTIEVDALAGAQVSTFEDLVAVLMSALPQG